MLLIRLKWIYTATHLSLLQLVIQYLPIYQSMVHVTLAYFLREFDTIPCQFLWSHNLQKSKWRLNSWDIIYRPKNKGGLSLLSSILSLQALTATIYQGWHSSKNKLCTYFITCMYFKGYNPFIVFELSLESSSSIFFHTFNIVMQG